MATAARSAPRIRRLAIVTTLVFALTLGLGTASFALEPVSLPGTAARVRAANVLFVWSGAITTSSARVNARLTADSAVARLAVSVSPQLSAPEYSLPDTALVTDNHGVVSMLIDGLSSSTPYYYAVEVNGVLDTGMVGRFRTFSQDTASFSFAFSSCAQTASSHAVFETIRALDPQFFFHLGDLHYENIGVDDRDVFRQAFDTVLQSPSQRALFQSMPVVYVWDDHDYGPNNSDSTAPGRSAARLTYREYVPHYPLIEGSGPEAIYHAFSVGRVRFVVCDARSARSPASAPDEPGKTMLGTAQKAWLKQELLLAKDRYALTVWVNSLPWIGDTGDDGWHLYTYERRELADFIALHNIRNLCMISGDAHMLAIDDGRNNDYATGGGASFPVMHAAALDRSGSIKGGPYSHGAFPGGGQFGLMTVTDNGDSVTVQWSGRNSLNQELVSYRFTYAVDLSTSVTEADGPIRPRTLQIRRAYPNPSNSSIEILYWLAEPGDVEVNVFNLLGQPVRTWFRHGLPGGRHRITWDGRNRQGVSVASGVYLINARAGAASATSKVQLIK